MRKLGLLTLLTFCFALRSHAQSFSKVINVDSASAWGSAWGDYNNDGYPDLYISCANNNVLLKNNGNGTFTRIYNDTIVTTSVWSQYRGCTWGDYNNDGYIDMYTTAWSGNGSKMKNYLFKNNGSGGFTNDTVPLPASKPMLSMAAGWADLDNDGRLDLVISNYIGKCHVFFNEGHDSFTELTTGAIVTDSVAATGIAFSDMDFDGYTDIVFCSEGPQPFFKNNGNRTFTKLNNAVSRFSTTGRGCSWGDFDNDGDMDLFLSARNNYASAIFRNEGNDSFTEVTSSVLGSSLKGDFEGSNWIDINNDGWLDLFVVSWTGSKNILYMNNGDGTFTQDTTSHLLGAGITRSESGTGNSWADFDQDGDMDCFITSYAGGESVLMKNNTTGNNHFSLTCIGVVSNRSAVGALIRVRITSGHKSFWQQREITTQNAGSYSGQNSLQQIFGLGSATQVDSININWPSGIYWDSVNIPANSSLTIYEHRNAPPGHSLQGVISGCSHGHIKHSKVYLIRFNPADTSLTAIDSTMTDSTGSYSFGHITDTLVYVYVAPDSATYPHEIPTYYDSSADFQGAHGIAIHHSVTTANFHTICGTNPGGTGFISGKIVICTLCKKSGGTPVVGLRVILTDQNGVIQASTLTNSAGYFSFHNIAIKQYKVSVDHPYVDNTKAPSVLLTTTNTKKDNLSFTLYPDYLQLNATTAVQASDPALSDISVFPNPASMVLNINYKFTAQVEASVKVYNTLGEEVIASRMAGTEGSLSLDVSRLVPGMYFMIIRDAEKVLRTEKIIRQ